MIVKKVLIVEDDLLIAGGMKVVLTAAGFLVTAIAPSSEKALEAIRAELPDVVLMDIELSDTLMVFQQPEPSGAIFRRCS